MSGFTSLSLSYIICEMGFLLPRGRVFEKIRIVIYVKVLSKMLSSVQMCICNICGRLLI